jgi:hypothetical protein
MRLATDAGSVQETRSELLGFRSVKRPDRPSRVTRSVSAKVGLKEQPRKKAGELLGFGSLSRPDYPARVKRSVSAKVGDKQQPPPGKAS